MTEKGRHNEKIGAAEADFAGTPQTTTADSTYNEARSVLGYREEGPKRRESHLPGRRLCDPSISHNKNQRRGQDSNLR